MCKSSNAASDAPIPPLRIPTPQYPHKLPQAPTPHCRPPQSWSSPAANSLPRNQPRPQLAQAPLRPGANSTNLMVRQPPPAFPRPPARFFPVPERAVSRVACKAIAARRHRSGAQRNGGPLTRLTEARHCRKKRAAYGNFLPAASPPSRTPRRAPIPPGRCAGTPDTARGRLRRLPG